MALFLSSSRYWPKEEGEEDGRQICQPAQTTMTLERLHQLASQRAARRKKAAQCDSKGELGTADLSQSPATKATKKKKRKKKTHVETRDEISEDDERVRLSEAEEEMKRMKLSNGDTLEDVSIPKKRKKKKREMEGDESSPLKDLQCDAAMADDRLTNNTEINVGTKKKKKKKKHLVDNSHSTADTAELESDGYADKDTVDQSSLEEIDEDQARDSQSQSSEQHEVQQNHLQESREERVASGDGQTDVEEPSLRPLGHKGRNMAATEERKQSVRRQLPQWIVDADIIPDDIIEQSRPVDEFSLPQPLLKNLARVHIDKLFPVQASVIPELLSSHCGPLLSTSTGLPPRDICVCAPTGCGKTLCYVIPIVSALLNRAVCQVRAVVVVPSHELAVQVQKVFNQVAHGTQVCVGVICGSLSFEKERGMLYDSQAYPPCSCLDVVVATPGRLVEHLDKNSFSTLHHLRYLVIDEADKLLDQHFNQWLPKILSSVEADKTRRGRGQVGRGRRSASYLRDTLLGLCASPERLQLMYEEERGSKKAAEARESDRSSTAHSSLFSFSPTSHLQKLLFSATMTQNPEHLAALSLHQPKLFTVASAVQSGARGSLDTAYTLPSQLLQYTVRCSLEHKPLVLLKLLSKEEEEERKEDMRRVLCFTNSKEATHRLCLLLGAFNLTSVGEISSSLGPGKRKAILDSFKSGRTQVLVCSDQLARGMDIEGVTCVMNYDPPRQYQTYLHRAGRTARAGQRGVVFTLLSREEVHPFNTMLRKVGRVKQVQEVAIPLSSLKPLLPAYQSALEQLRLLISNKR